MSVRRLAIVAGLVAVTLLTAVLPALAAKSYRAERFHSRLVVEPGGSILVTETVRFEFGPDSFTYVYRDLVSRKTDGLTILDVSMDGTPMQRGKGPGEFEVRREDNRRRVVWHFPATSNAGHTFTLTYRAAGVVWQDAGRDVLAWTLLPTQHDYLIECASGEVEYPASARLVGGARLNPPAGEEQIEGRAVRFLRCPFGRNESWVVEMDFAPQSVAAVAPQWQQRSIRNRENLALFLGLGALIVLAGVGGYLLFALNHRHPRTDDGGRASAPPDALPPALAGSLLQAGASAGWGPALGAIMDLARRGAISIQSVEGGGVFRSREVRITRGPTPVDAAAHERVLLDLLFTDKRGPRSSVTFSELARTFASSRRWKTLREAVASDLRGARLIDPERESTRRRMTFVALGIMLLAMLGLIASVALSEVVGDPVLALPIALFIVGIAGLISARHFSPLSEEGHRRAERWRAFKGALGGRSQDTAGAAPMVEHLERWLPYAVAFGTAMAWLKRLQRQGVSLGPSWLTAVSREGAVRTANMGATIAILSSGSSAGAHAGGHAGGAAGAAGGGGSGAG